MSRKMRLVWLPMILIAGVISVGGPLAASQNEDVALEGEYAVTIAAEDVPPELIDGASLIGRWRIVFGTDGSYSRGRQDVGTLASGLFEIDNDQVLLVGETGLLACQPGGDGTNDALYAWQVDGDRLQLVAIEEPCAVRRLLLTTRTLSAFVACDPQQSASSGVPVGTPRGGSFTGPSPTPATPLAADANAIDELLRRMSSCWATREPVQFLPLLSAAFRAELVPSGEDRERRFALRMGAPIVWDRAGDVETIDTDRIAVAVRQTAGDEVDLLRYAFVFEDGAWRWDGPADEP